MSATNKRKWRKLRALGAVAGDFEQLLEAFRALDRTVVEISMQLYNLPRRERAALRRQHRRLHDSIRHGLPRLLSRATMLEGTCAPSE